MYYARQWKAAYVHPKWKRWFVQFLDRFTRGEKLPLNIQYGAGWAPETT
jgi:hypothetical protein